MAAIDNYCHAMHDKFNLLVLPVISFLSMSYFVDKDCYYLLFYTFLSYMIIDSLWLVIAPKTVASPKVILVHHFMGTLGWLCGYYTSNIRDYTCTGMHQFNHLNTYSLIIVFTLIGVLVEINTFLLIYRRNYGRNLLTEILFYSTWIGIRIVLFTTILTNYASIFIIKDINVYKFSIEIHNPIEIYTATFFVISIVLMILNYYWTYDLLYKVLIDKSKTVSKGL